MHHPNIISFEHCFEDDGNVYMQLELCANGVSTSRGVWSCNDSLTLLPSQSLLDLLRKRRRYSEPEARYYLVQLIGACEYMHSNSVIHRDLKLGNLMLDAEMNLMVGDFGLAALVKFPGDRKKSAVYYILSLSRLTWFLRAERFVVLRITSLPKFSSTRRTDIPSRWTSGPLE